jgi:putative ABC transport system substrate-binding protein
MQDIPSAKQLEIEKGQGSAGLNDWIAKHHIKTLVSLGSQGLETCATLPGNVRLLAGALLTPPDNAVGCVIHGGIALAPSPDKLFARLKELKPDITQVSVVYNAGLNDWLIQYARLAAERNRLQLNAIAVDDLSQAAQVYKDLMSRGIGPKHAVWLPQDPFTVDQNTVLPVLLKASWDMGFVVFSSNPAHVSRGVLFALYPDYNKMGRSLGKQALQVHANGESGNKLILPLEDVLIAVNLRTAEHLKLVFSQKEKVAFDLVFPESR